MARKTGTRHAEQQRRYRENLRTKKSGDAECRGAPETRMVVQALASAIRELAAELKRSEGVRAAHGPAFQRVMRSAERSLVGKGFDAAESSSRLSLYVLPDDAKRRRIARETGRRWGHDIPI